MRSMSDGWIDYVILGNPPVPVSYRQATPLRVNEAQVPSRRRHNNLEYGEYGTTPSETSSPVKSPPTSPPDESTSSPLSPLSS